MPLPQINHTHSPQCDTFFYVARQWCLTQAAELLAADPGLAFEMDTDISGLDEILGITPAAKGTLRLLEIKINHDHAMGTDTSRPPLVVRMIADSNGVDYGPVVIDGWHRLYKMRREGKVDATVLMLDAAVEQAIRLPITLGPTPGRRSPVSAAGGTR